MPLSPAKSESDRLTGLLRPKYVAAWSDHDALFQGSVEALGEFGKAEILDHPEILVAQQFRQLDRIEKTEPWLAQRRRPRGNGHHILPAVGGIVFKRLGVVEHRLPFRYPGDGIQRPRPRIPPQILYNAKP